MTDTTTTALVDKAAVKEKLRVKIDEMFGKDDKSDPIIVERINQIANDAVASMPDTPKELSTEKPEETMKRRLKEQIETVKANSDVKPEMAAKLDQIVSAIETAMSEVKAGKTAPVKTAPPPSPTGPIPAPKV